MSGINKKCIACGSSKWVGDWFKNVSFWEYPDTFDYYRCDKCGLVFQKKVKTSKRFTDFYDRKTYWTQDLEELVKSGKIRVLRKKKFGKIFDFIVSKRHKDAIFDVGAGSGMFLSMFKKGWRVDGCDNSYYAKKAAKKYFGLDIILNKDFSEIKLPKDYDFVTMLNVLEHVPKPVSYLLKSKKILNNDGFLIIQVPNMNSLGSKIFGKKWYPLQPGKHLFSFTPKSLRLLLQNCGFKVSKIDHFNKEHSVYGLFQSIRYFRKSYQQGMGCSVKKVNINHRWRVKVFFVPLAYFISYFIYYVGALINMGEYITVFAIPKKI